MFKMRWGLRVEGWGLRIDGWQLTVEGWGLRAEGWGLRAEVWWFDRWGLRVGGWGLGFESLEVHHTSLTRSLSLLTCSEFMTSIECADCWDYMAQTARMVECCWGAQFSRAVTARAQVHHMCSQWQTLGRKSMTGGNTQFCQFSKPLMCQTSQPKCCRHAAAMYWVVIEFL